MAFYRKTGAETWHGRIDGTEPDLLRWHQIINCCDTQSIPKLSEHQQGVAIMGFCCDEGVRLNNGRTGAAHAPAAIRAACCNFPMIADHIVMIDAGDVVCDNHNLEEAQALMSTHISKIIAEGFIPIVLGGGHETALCGFKALEPLHKKTEVGIINFDAHFDLRDYHATTGGNSGTWAQQIVASCESSGNPLHYMVMGIQQYSNTRRLFEIATEKGFPYFLAEHFTNDQLGKILQTINGIIANADRLLVSLDMDVFAAPYAPGVSAVSFNGIAPNAMFKRLLRHIILSGKVTCVDISEVNPAYDIDNRTSRLAAAFVFDIVQAADINAEYPG
jgi:formiminoglutamase